MILVGFHIWMLWNNFSLANSYGAELVEFPLSSIQIHTFTNIHIIILPSYFISETAYKGTSLTVWMIIFLNILSLFTFYNIDYVFTVPCFPVFSLRNFEYPLLNGFRHPDRLGVLVANNVRIKACI